MTQKVKELLAKPENPSWILGMHTMEGEKWLPWTVLSPLSVHHGVSVYIHICTNTQMKNKKRTEEENHIHKVLLISDSTKAGTYWL